MTENRERLYSPRVIKQVMKRHGIDFNKSLGQNFLMDGNIVRKIREYADVGPEDVVLEVGPGIGTMTEELLLHAKKVIAIELDRNLIPVLEDTLSDFDNLVLVHADALQVDLKELLEREAGDAPVKVVANLPYYITTPLITRFFESDLHIQSSTVMVQQEVAERMVADATQKAYGSLSIFVQYYSDAKIVQRAPKEVFLPHPKVDSIVVHMAHKQTPEDVDEKLFFGIMHAGFQQRRKTILNSFTSNEELGITKPVLREALKQLGISPNARAENLSVDDYLKLTKVLMVQKGAQ